MQINRRARLPWPTDEAPFQNATDEPSFFEDEPPYFEDEPPFYEDGAPFEDEPPFGDTAEEPLIEEGSVQEVPLCAPGWLQGWYPDWVSGWWYFWWLQYCYTDENGWYRTYHGWDWGYPMY